MARGNFPNPVLMLGFAIFFLMAIPVILLKFSMDYVRDRIESKWPNNKRAMAFSFWLGLLWPVVLNVVVWSLWWMFMEQQRSAESAGPAIVSNGVED